nr:MFS transporter [Deinobacterium chartae]
MLLIALSIELIDELVDGASGAAWPSIRSELSLSYLEVGLLLGLPTLLSILVEPAMGLLADAGWRRRLILGGGSAFTAALALLAAAGGFWPLLAAWALFYPASGAFVTLTQAALMDADPGRREQNMARWALAGSLGNFAGPLMMGLFVSAGAGWRPVFVLLALVSALALLAAWRAPALLGPSGPQTETASLRALWQDGLDAARSALRRADVRGALLLLECANLLLDVLRAFLALYLVDAAGSGPAEAALAVAIFTGAGLLGDALAVRVLERVAGARYVWWSALAAALVFAAFLLVPSVTAKLILLAALGPLTSGWYAVLQARLYGLLPERSGTAVALGTLGSALGAGVPVLLGLLAQRLGLEAAMWLLLLGPLALLLGLQRAAREAAR